MPNNNIPKGTIVVITTTNQIDIIHENVPFHECYRILGIGLVPYKEIRLATNEEIANSRFNDKQIN